MVKYVPPTFREMTSGKLGRYGNKSVEWMKNEELLLSFPILLFIILSNPPPQFCFINYFFVHLFVLGYEDFNFAYKVDFFNEL